MCTNPDKCERFHHLPNLQHSIHQDVHINRTFKCIRMTMSLRSHWRIQDLFLQDLLVFSQSKKQFIDQQKRFVPPTQNEPMPLCPNAAELRPQILGNFCVFLILFAEGMQLYQAHQNCW